MPFVIAGDTIDVRPTLDQIKPGWPFRVPIRSCQTLDFANSTFQSRPALASDKAALLNYTQFEGLNWPEPFLSSQFALKGYPLQAIFNRTLCPWGDHNAVQFTVTIDFRESVSPSNFADAPQVTVTDFWPNNSDYTTSYTSGVVSSSPYADLGGGVPWQFTLELKPLVSDCDVIPRGIATLTSTNYDFLNGTPVVQDKNEACLSWQEGTATLLAYFWTGEHFNPGNPIGLVRSMSVSVRGSMIYT